MNEYYQYDKKEKINYEDKTMTDFIKSMENYDTNTLKKDQKLVKLTTIKSIFVNDLNQLPFKIDFQMIKQKMLNLNVIKQIAIISLQKRIDEALNFEQLYTLSEQLFWMIFCMAYPEQSSNPTQIIQELQQKSSLQYFQLLKRVEQEIVMSSIIMYISYMIHLAFYTYFKGTIFQKQGSFQQFNNRFITNCYNIVLKQLNGIDINYLYLKTTMEKTFHMQNFLAYKIQKKKETTPIKAFEIPNDEAKKTQNQFFNQLSQNLQPTHKLKFIQVQPKIEIEKDFISNKNVKNKFFNCQQISPTVQNMLNMKDNGIPSKNRRIIKHTSHNKEIDQQFRKKIERIQNQNQITNSNRSMQQDISNQQSNSNYQKLRLFNINSNDIDQTFTQKYPNYAQYFNDELELQSILKKNDMRMTNLRSSQYIIQENKITNKSLQQNDLNYNNKKKENQTVDNFMIDINSKFEQQMNQFFNNTSENKRQIYQESTKIKFQEKIINLNIKRNIK